MRTAAPARAPFGAKLATFCAALFFVALSIAVAPNVMDALARFGLIHTAAAPPAQIHTLAIPTYAPALVPVTPPQPPQAPQDTSAAPALAPPISAPTAAPVQPGIKIIVVKPADGSGPIVVTKGTKYRGRP